MCEVCSELAKKTPEIRQWRCHGFSIVDTKQVNAGSYSGLVFFAFLVVGMKKLEERG